MKNKKKFGLISIILLGMNAIIGSGIFLLPGQAYDLGEQAACLYFCSLHFWQDRWPSVLRKLPACSNQTEQLTFMQRKPLETLQALKSAS